MFQKNLNFPYQFLPNYDPIYVRFRFVQRRENKFPIFFLFVLENFIAYISYLGAKNSIPLTHSHTKSSSYKPFFLHSPHFSREILSTVTFFINCTYIYTRFAALWGRKALFRREASKFILCAHTRKFRTGMFTCT